MKNVIILGASGHAKVLAEIVVKSNDNLIGFLDDNEVLFNKDIYLDKRVLGNLNDITKYKDNYFIIGIGNNKIRKDISLKYNDLNWYNAIHPNAVIASDVKVGEGTVIMPGVVINPGTIIGKHCIINTSSSVDHDNIIGNFVHISPGAHLAGTVTVGEGTWICMGVNVINNIKIGNNDIIGAGATVINDVLDDNKVYVGVPAKEI